MCWERWLKDDGRVTGVEVELADAAGPWLQEPAMTVTLGFTGPREQVHWPPGC